MSCRLNKVLIVGSAPDANRIKSWDLSSFSTCLVINNAWKLTEKWNYLIHPEDMPKENLPPENVGGDKKIITAREYVPEQNRFGGFVYGGGTMAFTAGYWALGALNPDMIAYVGCDMIYPENKDKKSHFYGKGEADPLRQDITLQSLEAKSARLMALAHANHCRIVNLSELAESRLLFPRIPIQSFLMNNKASTTNDDCKIRLKEDLIKKALKEEETLGYMVPSGRYWEAEEKFDAQKLRAIDAIWMASALMA